jgi:hypothetical protein
MNAPDFNCLAFRREKLADPSRLSDAARAHLADCQLCQAFARRIDQNEQKIIRALDVPIPEGLNDRLMLAVRGRRTKPWRAWALAATVIASFGAGMFTFRGHGEYDPARFAIEHVMHEPESFSTARLASSDEFRAVMAHFGAELDGQLGHIRYMKLCPGPEGTGWHVVLDTDHGLVSLFLIPGDKVKLPAEKSMKGYTAMALPGGLGYYAIVGTDEAAVAAFAQEMHQKVRWRI